MQFLKELQEYAKFSSPIKMIIDWYDLPDRQYLTLDRNFQTKLMKKFLAETKNQDIKKIAGVNIRAIYAYLRDHSKISVKILRNICRHLNFPRVFDDEGNVHSDKSGKRAVRLSRSINIDNYLSFPIEINPGWTKKPIPKRLSITCYWANNLCFKDLGLILDAILKGFINQKKEYGCQVEASNSTTRSTTTIFRTNKF